MKTQRMMALAGVAALALAACEAPQGMQFEQTGHKGSGMAQVENPRLVSLASAYVPPPPYELEPDTGGERSRDVYENVPVLGHLSPDEFNRLMVSITEWVSPEGKVVNGGCNYCHNPENMASDEVYTKVVARRMLQQTMNINQNWQSHVQKTGVTCWTCHRGNPVPTQVWSDMDGPAGMARDMGGVTRVSSIRGNKRGQNTPLPATAYASLPYDAFSAYFSKPDETERLINVASNDAYPRLLGKSLQETEATYGLMMHFANSLGVNCTYCHNSQAFSSYSLANPTKPLAWHAIRMTRDINWSYITPLTAVFPANRLGPKGDPYKVNCATCHQGLAKPMNGVSMLPDHPSLKGWPAGVPQLTRLIDPVIPGRQPYAGTAPAGPNVVDPEPPAVGTTTTEGDAAKAQVIKVSATR